MAKPDEFHQDQQYLNSALGLVRGTVTDTVDPQGNGRVKMTLPAVAAEEMWAVVLQGVAPQLGDLVAVIFEGNKADSPVVLGSFRKA